MTANKKILVIEDDHDQLLGMRLRLAASGYDVAQATDGIEAIGVAHRERPDLILLDLGLPGEDGYRVMENLRTINTTPSTPIVVISGRDPAAHGTRALAAGAEAFLQKPVDHDDLLRTLRKALGEEPPGSPVPASASLDRSRELAHRPDWPERGGS
jgi:CheY-like chemotaxis protein